MNLYVSNWDRRRWNHTNNSPGVRRAFSHARRMRDMPSMHWTAYILDTSRPLLHNGRKPRR